MMKLAAVLLVLFASAASADDSINKDDAYDLINEFSRCAAILDALARLTSSSAEEFAENTLHETANGARVTAMMLALAADLNDSIAENLYESHTNWLNTALRLRTEAGTAEQFISEDITPEIDRCAELNKLQGEIIKQLRIDGTLE